MERVLSRRTFLHTRAHTHTHRHTRARGRKNPFFLIPFLLYKYKDLHLSVNNQIQTYLRVIALSYTPAPDQTFPGIRVLFSAKSAGLTSSLFAACLASPVLARAAAAAAAAS